MSPSLHEAGLGMLIFAQLTNDVTKCALSVIAWILFMPFTQLNFEGYGTFDRAGYKYTGHTLVALNVLKENSQITTRHRSIGLDAPWSMRERQTYCDS